MTSLHDAGDVATARLVYAASRRNDACAMTTDDGKHPLYFAARRGLLDVCEFLTKEKYAKIVTRVHSEAQCRVYISRRRHFLCCRTFDHSKA